MATSESSTSPEGSLFICADWDAEALADALDQTSRPIHDPAHGPGLRFDLTTGLLVEVFPPHAERRTGVLRFTSEDARQEFYRQPAPTIRPEGIIFDTADLLINLSPAGGLLTRRRVSEDPVTRPDASNDGAFPNVQDGRDEGHTDDPAAPQGPIPTALPETGPQPRVAYRGRLGTDPRTKTTPKGKFVMEFPVAVAVEGRDNPEWRDTVVFDAKARALEGVLARGSRVAVVAYEHTRRHEDSKTGAVREAKEYYATSVTPETPVRSASDDAATEQRP